MRKLTLKKYQYLINQGDKLKTYPNIEKLLLQTSTKKFKTIEDIGEIKLVDFVALENYVENNNYVAFCSIFVKKKFFETIYFCNLQAIMTDYGNKKNKLFENYPYIFDPPVYGEPQKETIGSELRKDFVNEFGVWVVLMDLVSKGKLVDYKKIEQWKLSEFLFWANYLSGQKIIENIK